MIRFLAYGALWWWMVGQLHKDKGEKGSDFRKMNALHQAGIGVRDFYVNGIMFVLKYGVCGICSDEAGEANACMVGAAKSRKLHCRGNRVEDTTRDVTGFRLVSTVASGTYKRKEFREHNNFPLVDVVIDQQIFARKVKFSQVFTSFHKFPQLFCV